MPEKSVASSSTKDSSKQSRTVPSWLIMLLGIMMNLQIITVLQLQSIRQSLGAINDAVLKIPSQASDTKDQSKASASGQDGPNTLAKQKQQQGPKVSWQDIKQETLMELSRVAFESTILPDMTMDTFFAKFLADDAPFSIPRFLTEEIGDMDVKASKWETTGKEEFSRIIKYRHKVSNPLAPATAAAEKHDTLRKYGKHGILLETKTIVKDVPKTDCFVVLDRILVESSSKNSIKSVEVTARFEIQFIKKTMFKSIIERSTSSELEDFFGKYKDMIRNVAMGKALISRATSVDVGNDDGAVVTNQKWGWPIRFRMPW